MEIRPNSIYEFPKDHDSKVQTACFELFVGGLALRTTDEDLFQYFSQFGPLAAAKISRSKNGKSKKFGYLSFIHNIDGFRVLQLQTFWLHGNLIKVEEAIDSGTRAFAHRLRSQRKLFIGGIPNGADPQQIWDLLSLHGEVESLTKFRKSNTLSLYTIVTMRSAAEASRIISLEHLVFSSTYQIYVKRFVPKLQREAIQQVPDDLRPQNSPEYGPRIEFLGESNGISQNSPVYQDQKVLNESMSKYSFGNVQAASNFKSKILSTRSEIQNSPSEPKLFVKLRTGLALTRATDHHSLDRSFQLRHVSSCLGDMKTLDKQASPLNSCIISCYDGDVNMLRFNISGNLSKPYRLKSATKLGRS